jgi:protein O-mannosyl-transferase
MRRDPGLACVVLAVVAVVAVYAVTLSRGLVNLDDPWLIRDNWIVQDASWSSLHTIFFDLDSPRRFTLAPEYLPVRDLSIVIDFAIWGDWYGGFHLTNLALYVAAIVVWFKVLVGFGIDRRVAGVALLLWALHPAHAESVAWLSERKGLLGVVFAGACGLGYLRFRDGRSPGWLVLAVLLAVCAVWSKAIAAFSLAALGALELTLPSREAGRRRFVGLGAIGIVAAAAFVPVLLLASSSHVVGTDEVAPAGRVEMVLGVLGFYVRLGSMTTRNSVSYPISDHGPSTIEVLLGVVALIALAWLLAAPKRFASPTLRAAAALFVVGWLPVSHLILPLQMVFVADRYLLFPSLGIALALAYGVSRIASPRARRALLITLVVAATLRTIDAQSTWRNNTALWQRAVETNPSDGDAWSMYADAVMETGRMDLAFEVVSRGLRHSRSPRVMLRKALFLIQAGKREAGTRAMREAALAGEPRAQLDLSLLLLEAGQIDEALAWAKKSADALPMHAPARRALGKVALNASQPQLALTEFEFALALEPKNLTNHFNVALALITVGRARDALPYLEASRRDPALAPQVRKLLDDMRR